MTILVTGGNGFIGKALCIELIRQGHDVKATVRNLPKTSSENIKFLQVDDINSETNWHSALINVNTVIHTAARVHIMNENISDSLIEYRKINTEGTLNLAIQAAEAGIKRFIFISSIKVNGDFTLKNQKFKPDDVFVPFDPYGLSKYEAEQSLLDLSHKTNMDVVIIRPPLVYGPGVKANFYSMMKWVKKDIPLPLGSIDNTRSLVALDNLISFIIHCLDHPKAKNEIFLISDNEDISTAKLLRKIAKAFGKHLVLIPIPVWFISSIAKLIGKSSVANRLCSSLQVDSSKSRNLLGWRPVTTIDKQLKKIAETFIKNEETL